MIETIWFLLWGILWAIYFVLDGFDLGLGTLLPFVAKNEAEKRLVYQSMGPFWDGNEVWLITAGGVTFAAFPAAYAVLFSAFYTPLMLILFALIFRAVSFEFREKREEQWWRSLWDMSLTLGSFFPALLFGVAFANIFKGIPIDGEGVFKGTLLTLLNPYGLLGGVFFLSLFLVHGSLWLAVKSEGELQTRAGKTAKGLWAVLLVVAVLFLGATAVYTPLYGNYLKNPLLFLIPLVAVAALLSARVFMAAGRWWKAWFSSAIVIAASVIFGVVGLYPNLLPSSLNGSYSLSIRNAASSPLTLKIMLIVAVIFVPIVLAYQTWVYLFFKGKVRAEEEPGQY